MGRLAIICITWMVLSAATAYYADIWGRRLGKQRKTIGRLRPKHTAIVIITTAGALIALLSFVILLTADAGIRRALLNWDQTMVKILALEIQSIQQKQDLTALDAKIAAQEGELDARTALIASVEGRMKAALDRLAGARKEFAGLQVKLAAVQKELQSTSTRLGDTSEKLRDTRGKLERAKADVERTKIEAFQAGAAALRVANDAQKFVLKANEARRKTLYGHFAARSGEEMGRAVIPRGITPNGARERLRKLMNGASVLIQSRSKSGSYSAGKLPLQMQPKYVTERVDGRNRNVRISGMRLLDVVGARLADPRAAPGGTVVRLLAQANTLVGETVPVDFELFENHVVFEKGQEIVSLVIKSSQGKPAVMSDLTNALKDVRSAALKNGLMPTADNSVGSLPPYQLPDVYSEVQRAFREGQQTVRVRIFAARDTWTSDELTLRFEVKRYQEGA